MHRYRRVVGEPQLPKRNLDSGLLRPGRIKVHGHKDDLPIAATLLLRASIQYVLTYGIATRYAEAARQLLEAESLSAMIGDFGEYPDHAAFVADLRAMHGRKQGFRAELEALGASF